MYEKQPLVKICGITTQKQAIEIAELGVNAIGIISVKESPRYVHSDLKNEIFKSLELNYPKIKRVSVIKNLEISSISEDFVAHNENVLQLHGDENIEYCLNIKKQFPKIEIWKAFRIKTKTDIEKISLYKNHIDAVLLDSWNETTYGGSGKRIQIDLLKNLEIKNPWWLAGGISIDWIEDIMSEIKPDGIDISSSIEILPGVKDIRKLKKLMKKINCLD